MDAVLVHVAQQVLGVGVALLGRLLEPLEGLPVIAFFQAAPIVDPPHNDLGEVHALFGIGEEGIQNFGPQLVCPHLVAEDVAEQMLCLDVVGGGQFQQYLRGLLVFVVAVELHGLLIDGRTDPAAGCRHLVGALSFGTFGRRACGAKFGPERSGLGLGLTFAEQLRLEHLVDLRIDDVEDARNHVVPLGLVVEVVAQGLRLRGVNLPLVNPVDDAFRLLGDVADEQGDDFHVVLLDLLPYPYQLLVDNIVRRDEAFADEQNGDMRLDNVAVNLFVPLFADDQSFVEPYFGVGAGVASDAGDEVNVTGTLEYPLFVFVGITDENASFSHGM